MNDYSLHTNRHGARRLQRPPTPLRSLTATVRSIALTPQGHVSCVFDTPAGRLRAFSDAATAHLPELRPGRRVRAVLLRIQRVSNDTTWQWQLLGCQGLREGEEAVDFEQPERSRA